MRTRTPKVKKDGWTWWNILYTPWLVQCCDCGLVHEYQFRRHPKKKAIQWRATRDETLTKQQRKRKREHGPSR